MAKNQNTVESTAEGAANSTNQTSISDQENQNQTPQVTGENSGLNLREEALNERESALNQREELLDTREEALNERDYELRAEILTIQNKQLLLDQKSQELLPQNPVVESSDVIAVKDGNKQSFPLSAWNNLGPDKNGWTRDVVVPKEVQEG